VARDRLNPELLTFAGMSQAVAVESLVYVSGQVALGSDGTIIGLGDPQAQAEQCFHNLRRVLAAGDFELRHVVKLTCFLTDVAHFAAYAAVKQRLFADHPPATTTVIVAALLDPEMLMEVEAVAIGGP
jgi:2-iminobutanoate/2-iminopropanoate deaminase